LKLDNIDIDATLNEVEKLLKEDKQLTPALKSMITVLVLLVKLLTNRVGLNSRNSSKPPSTDFDKKINKENPNRKKSGKKIGGQIGHAGSTLQQIENPDDVKILRINRRSLPKGDYEDGGFAIRQVFDLDISRWVTEYQAQILINKKTGKRHAAFFPDGITKAVQYGSTVKAHAVYMSQYQLLPYNRVQEFFTEQLGIPLSEGTLFNFNKDAFKRLKPFDQFAKNKLTQAIILHVDETGININGEGHWLHCATNASWTHFFPHKNRGNIATDLDGILPAFKGVLCHDHWKPYYCYTNCLHSLCNAHHLRELTRAWEQDKQEWAKQIKALLEEMNRAVHKAGGKLGDEASEHIGKSTDNYWRKPK